MINCPQCGTPNPEGTETCLACGVNLVGGAAPADEAAQAAAQPAAESAQPAAAQPAAPEPAPAFVASQPLDPAAAQAEINNFVAAQAAKRRKKSAITTVIILAALGAGGFYFWKSAQAKKELETSLLFVKAFNEVDVGPVGDFWKCAVRAKHKDVALVKSSEMIKSALERAFRAFPTSQPSRLSRRCLPTLRTAGEQFGKLTPPADFKVELDKAKAATEKIVIAFKSYIKKLELAKAQAQAEKRLLAAQQAFHDPNEADPTKAGSYGALIACAVPELETKLKAIKKPPDTQPLVEHIYNTCKADAKYADKLRKKCIDRLDGLDKPKFYKAMRQKMAGDGRDGAAIKDCFKRANRTLFSEELASIEKSWVEYRNAVAGLRNKLAKYKEQG